MPHNILLYHLKVGSVAYILRAHSHYCTALKLTHAIHDITSTPYLYKHFNVTNKTVWFQGLLRVSSSDCSDAGTLTLMLLVNVNFAKPIYLNELPNE